METTPKQRTKCRQYCRMGQNTSIPVQVIKGDYHPNLIGYAGGHFTKSGDRIVHRGAYAKKGFSNMIYRTSTLRIVVGEGWIKNWEKFKIKG